MKTLTAIAGATAIGAALLGAAALPAQAKRGPAVIKVGDCSGVANWKLKVAPEDAGFQIEGQVDSNRAGQRWTWAMAHNGTTTASGVRLTAGTSGAFTVRRTASNKAGIDTFVFRARQTSNGQLCRAVIRY